MKTDRKWIVVRIDGKIAAVSTDYRMLARISEMLAGQDSGKKTGKETFFGEITARTVCFDEVWKLRHEVCWDDLMLFGTDFQKKVWRKLWELTHMEETDASTTNTKTYTRTTPTGQATRLVSYSDFAELCQNRAGVRAVAHAVGLNPVSVIIPCHLVVPKESIDKIREIRKKAESTIFRGDDLCLESILLDPAIDFGEYALGKRLKRELISMELIK